jgi:hypothetical protein
VATLTQLSEFATVILDANVPLAICCNDALSLTSTLRQASYIVAVITKARLAALLKVHACLIGEFGSSDGEELRPVSDLGLAPADKGLCSAALGLVLAPADTVLLIFFSTSWHSPFSYIMEVSLPLRHLQEGTCNITTPPRGYLQPQLPN